MPIVAVLAVIAERIDCHTVVPPSGTCRQAICFLLLQPYRDYLILEVGKGAAIFFPAWQRNYRADIDAWRRCTASLMLIWRRVRAGAVLITRSAYIP
jgi:hypothetical protein